MFSFFKKKKQAPEVWDREALYPVIRVSICTGEEVAGFRCRATGKFQDVMLLRGEEDLREFMDRYGLTEVPVHEY